MLANDTDHEDLLEFVGSDDSFYLSWNDEGYSLTATQPSLLMQPLKHYLGQRSSYCLRAYLNILAASSAPFVQTVTAGRHKRWWLGAFIKSVANNHLFSAAEVEKAALVARKVLRHYDCDYPLPDDPGFSDIDFPILPEDEPNMATGVLNQADLYFLWHCFDKFANGQATFTEWPDWLNEISQTILGVRQLPYQSPRLISFLS